MIRLALLVAVGLVTAGCQTSRKVVVQNGYPGVKPPPGFESRPAPARGPDAPTPGESNVTSPRITTNP